MKRKILTTVMVFTVFFIGLGIFANCQAPPPPPPGGQQGDQPLPLGSPLAVIAILGIGLGVKKLYDANKKFNIK